jgi:apolipoprotein N-acyltransferase
MVSVAHRLALSGLVALSLAIVGVVLLIFDVVRGPVAGWAAAGAVTVLLFALWFGFPLVIRTLDDSEKDHDARP